MRLINWHRPAPIDLVGFTPDQLPSVGKWLDLARDHINLPDPIRIEFLFAEDDDIFPSRGQTAIGKPDDRYLVQLSSLWWPDPETVFHELVHVEQQARGDLQVKDGKLLWLGRTVSMADYHEYQSTGIVTLEYELEANQRAKAMLRRLEYVTSSWFPWSRV